MGTNLSKGRTLGKWHTCSFKKEVMIDEWHILDEVGAHLEEKNGRNALLERGDELYNTSAL